MQTVSGAVNFYSAVLNLGSLTCQLLLKEYPPSTKSLGINELRIYEEVRVWEGGGWRAARDD